MATKGRTHSGKVTFRFVGAAFLLQAAASAVVGLVLLTPLIDPENIVDTMTNLSANVLKVRASIVVEMVTVIALVTLSALLYVTLRVQNRNVALVALGLRLTEVALLAVSRVATFALLRTSQASVLQGHPAYLQTLGSLFYESQQFTYSLNMVFFSLGATLFYYLFYKSGYVPRVLSLCALIAAPVAFIGTLIDLLGVSVPLFVFIPNLPLELAFGLWLAIVGVKTGSEASWAFEANR